MNTTTEATEALGKVRKMVAACMQCGTCTASCPNGFAMDMTPRRMWRNVILGRLDEVLSSRTFWLCSACYTCTLRCPRGLPLTEAIGGLKRLAALAGGPGLHHQTFYRTFMENVHTYGRVQETALMTDYFMAMKSPLLPLSYAPLGLKMLMKGKLSTPSGKRKGKLERMFAKVADMERREARA